MSTLQNLKKVPESTLGRPKTAGLMQPGVLKGTRPQTGAVIANAGAGIAGKSSMKKFMPSFAGRANSAGFPLGQKSNRCEGVINRLKKSLEDERRLQRTMKTMLSQEIDTKN